MKTLLRLFVVSAAASLFPLALATAPAIAQDRIPDYGNMVLLGTVPVDDKVDALAFTPDSKILIASDKDTFRAYDANTGEIASDKDTFRAYDANTGEAVKTISAPKGVRSNFVLFTKDAKTMITANSDGAIRFYDWESGEVKQTLEGHQSPMIGLVLSPSGKLLASSGTDRLVKVWDVETGKLVQELSGFSYAAPILIFSEDEKTLTTFGGINTRKLRTEKFIWSLEDGGQKQTDVIDDFGPPYAATADGTTLVGKSIIRTKVSSTDFREKQSFRTYQVVSGEVGKDVINLFDRKNFLTFAPNKAVLVINSLSFNSSKAGQTYFWDGMTYDYTKIPHAYSAPAPEIVAFSPDSKTFATWFDNLKVNIYRAP